MGVMGEYGREGWISRSPQKNTIQKDVRLGGGILGGKTM